MYVIFCIAIVPNFCTSSAAILSPYITYFLQEASTGKWHNVKQQDVTVFVCSTGKAFFVLVRRMKEVNP